jgi:replicative DNA helicase
MIERELIAAVLTKPSVLWECTVEPEHFTSEVHADIWRTILDLQHKGESFDAVTVSQAMGGEAGARVIEIANESIGAPASASGYARRIVEVWRGRVAGDIYAQAQNGDLTRDEVIRKLMTLDDQESRFECDIKQAMRWALDDMEAAAEAGGDLRGITTGLVDLDKHLGGWHDGDLVVLGARPAMGKTALMLHFAQRAGVPLGVVSSEQPAYQIAQRHAASLGKVSLSNLRQGKVGGKETQAVMHANRTLRDYWILDRSSPTITEVERVARRWHHKHGIKLLLVDYIQRIRGHGEKRHEQVGDVVRSLKTLARDLDIPVIALSQVGRQVESRQNDRRPRMGDLSDSSEIEKEADQVLTLYRDEVYDEKTEDKGIAEISICKNRHGYVGTVHCEWIGEFVSFGDMTYPGKRLEGGVG